MNFQQLLGESVSATAVAQLEEQLQVTLQEAVAEKDAEINNLKEAIQNLKEESTNEVNALKESIQKYEEYVLEESANKDAEYAEKIAELKEHAQSYGESIYNELVEKANDYTQQFITEYKEQNPIIQENETAKDVLENIKEIFERFGMDTEQNTIIDDLKESVSQKDAEIFELKQSLYENDFVKQKELVVDELTSDLSLNEREEIKEASMNIITESVDEFRRVVSVLTRKYNTDNNNDKVNNLQENVNSINTNTVTYFDKLSNKNASVSKIAEQII